MATDFGGSTGMRERLRSEVLRRWMVLVFVRTKWDQKNLAEWAAGLSTGCAQEMQKGSWQK